MAQAPHPTFINIPPPGSNPETSAELPDTPTSTTTSLSALSTTAIKDGHRGHLPGSLQGRGHQHNPSTTSLEAERADRISRLAGLERVSTLRAPPTEQAQTVGGGASSLSPQTTPTSTTGFPPNFPASHNLTPSYFDGNGQPVAVTKMSTVGTASATESHLDEGEVSRQTGADHDEDMLSTDTNSRETTDSVTSTGAEPDAMDEDMEGIATHSVGAYEDRMSDDGSASLVGFGEGANSTVSGPIYHRRVMPGSSQSHPAPWAYERTVSGLSDLRRDRDVPMSGGGSDNPVSAAVIQERRDARMMDGVAVETPPGSGPVEQDSFVDTTVRGPIPSTRQHHRDTAERLVQHMDGREARPAGSNTLGSGRGGETLGKFYFEGEKER